MHGCACSTHTPGLHACGRHSWVAAICWRSAYGSWTGTPASAATASSVTSAVRGPSALWTTGCHVCWCPLNSQAAPGRHRLRRHPLRAVRCFRHRGHARAPLCHRPPQQWPYLLFLQFKASLSDWYQTAWTASGPAAAKEFLEHLRWGLGLGARAAELRSCPEVQDSSNPWAATADIGCPAAAWRCGRALLCGRGTLPNVQRRRPYPLPHVRRLGRPDATARPRARPGGAAWRLFQA